YSVKDIATNVAATLELDETAAMAQLLTDLPKEVDVDSAQYQLVNKLNPLLTEPVMDFAYASSGKPYNAAITDAYTDLIDAEASEHSTGLAFDWLGTEWTGIGGSLDEAYADQPSAQWLSENAQDYGFILRYPQGKEQVTGYSFEPWHYRYVGVEAAQYIAQYE